MRRFAAAVIIGMSLGGEAPAQAPPPVFHGVHLTVANRDMDGELTFRFHVYFCERHSGDAAIPLKRGQEVAVVIAGCDLAAADMVHLIVEGFRDHGRQTLEFMTRATCRPTGAAGGPAAMRLALSGDPMGAVKAACD